MKDEKSKERERERKEEGIKSEHEYFSGMNTKALVYYSCAIFHTLFPSPMDGERKSVEEV